LLQAPDSGASGSRPSPVMQIFEGTNQIQRMVIARHLARV
jgi:alkylation response protein AidB-like acyl-CoA dehydrogenase